MKSDALNSFPKETILFLKKLSKNNNREWFEANRELYNSSFLEPALNFVVEMGEKLSTIAPAIHAIPKIDKSIFRIYRDVRFSKNKQPYKTHLGIFFWEGKRRKMECPGFYFHLEPEYFMIGAGLYMFPKDLLKKYRDTVAEYSNGKELDGIIQKIKKKPGFVVGGKNYKKIPRGYDPEYPFAEYLLFNGLYAGYESNDATELNRKDVINFIFKKFKDMLPLHQWLVNNLG